MTQDRRITDKLPGHSLQWDDSASPSAAPAAGQAGLATDYVMMPKRLTAENCAKSLFMGEFNESVRVPCHECEGSGVLPSDDDADCHECKGEGTVEQRVAVEWDTIKRIYALAVEHLAAPVAAGTEQATDRQLAKDAARYRWLVKDGKSMHGRFTLVRCDDTGPLVELPGWEYDAAIDAAMGAAPLATPADAGAGQNERARFEHYAEHERGMEAHRYTRDAHFNTWQDAQREILARLSTPGAPVTAATREAFEAWMRTEGWENQLERYNVYDPDDTRSYKNRHTTDKWEGWEACAKFLGQSPAPVTAEPVQSIDTPEFRNLLQAWADEASSNSELRFDALITHIDRHIAPAPADRDAIRDQAHNSAIDAAAALVAACDKRATPHGIAVAVRQLKRMERAADAAETRDVKGDDHE